MRRIWVLPLLLALSLHNWSQVSVGSTRANFLTVSPSVRANGMGEIGVVRVDNQAMFYNPGTLSFVDGRYGSVSIYPGYTNLAGDGRYKYVATSILLRLKPGLLGSGSSNALVLAYQHLGQTAGPFIELTYGGGPDNTGRTFYWKDGCEQFTVGFGYSGKIDFGWGATLKYISESVHDYKASSAAVDFGFLFRIPLVDRSDSLMTTDNTWRYRLSMGAALANIGPALTFIEKEYPLPKTGRLGVGMDIRYGSGQSPLISMFPAVQVDILFPEERETTSRVGIEIGFRQALFLYGGAILKSGRSTNTDTFGFTVSSKGIRRMLSAGHRAEPTGQNGLLSFLLSNLDLEFSFAREMPHSEYLGSTNFYSIDITL